MPKAGHSKNAQDGDGFRTRLKARVIHLRAGTTSVALIAADIHAGSAVVHRLVASAVQADTDIPLAGLFLGATHTHAAPGQYHGCDFYNRWASNRPGFDPAYTQYLVDRLSSAVREAHATRRPARTASGRTEVWGVTRNRSLSAHVRNGTVLDKRLEAQRKYRAVNPWLRVLRVDAQAPDGGYAPLAGLAIYSIHGTGISRHDPSYNADVWAYITGQFRHRVESDANGSVVIGAVEGSHGDMTPAVRAGMLVFPEAERIGRAIGESAADLYSRLEQSLSGDVELAAGFREIDLDTRPRIAGITLPDPAVGVAKLAGASENNSPVVDRIPPFKAGYPKPSFLAGREQGAKWVFAGAALQKRINPVSTFPRVLPLQILRIGPLAVLALPFEVTVEAGRRLEESTADALGGDTDVVVSSVANDYWDYLTTPEEYQQQCYEGASTLYGPRSHQFVAAAVADLARRLVTHGAASDTVAGRQLDFHMHRYLPPATGRVGRPEQVGRPRFVEATSREDAYWEFGWTGAGPGDLRWDRPMVRIEALATGEWGAALDADGRPLDDQGWRIGVTYEGGHRYLARWYGPPLGPSGRHRFVVDHAGGVVLLGTDFD
jgi:neutral ceramidase